MTKTPDIMIIEAAEFPLAKRTHQLHKSLLDHDGLRKIIVVIDKAGHGWSVYGSCLCDSIDSAQKAVELVLDTIAEKLRTLIRVRPIAHSDMDFETKIEKHIGYTRFLLIVSPGEWEDIPPADGMIGFSEMNAVANSSLKLLDTPT